MKKIILIVIALFPCVSLATESMMSLEQAIESGFVPFKSSAKNLIRSERIILNVSQVTKLDWPFEQPYRQGFLGNNFSQYQPYGPAGYHAGTDMVLERDSWILAPIDGLLEAGHYTYVHSPDGSREKYWKPWPQSGDANYFELAVIDEQGYRYELHHVEKKSIPSDIVDRLNDGNYRVQAGQRLAKVVRWGTFFHYDHVHLNVYSPEGNELNPEVFFAPLEDTIKPDIKFLAKLDNQKTIWLRDGGRVNQNIQSLYILGADQKDSSIWRQAVQEFSLENNDQVVASVNFARDHYSQNGDWQDIRDVYPLSLRLPNRAIFRQSSGFYPQKETSFLMQIDMRDLDLEGIRQLDLIGRDSNQNETKIRITL